jgi:lysine 2,3-aminomutase
VTVRNQSVLLRGVNDDLKTMSALIRGLADINIQPVCSSESLFVLC